MIQGVFTVAVLVVLFFLRANEMVWVKTLKLEVETKTRDLEEYARRLRASEERYRSLVESADDLIYVLDKTGKILSMNERWSRLTGRDVEEVVGEPTPIM
jgi:two-component system NtrC family sensor kinase